MALGHVNYGSWFLRVLAWDGVLPAFIAFAPTGVEVLFPNHRGAVEITAVTLPIAAFGLRIRAGKRHIASNRCSEVVRFFQFCAFCLGILPLVLVDCFMILSHLMPGAMFETYTDILICAITVSVYLTLMAVAMYPGRAIPSALDWEDGTAFGEGGWPEQAHSATPFREAAGT
jgi:hypothetical protein